MFFLASMTLIAWCISAMYNYLCKKLQNRRQEIGLNETVLSSLIRNYNMCKANSKPIAGTVEIPIPLKGNIMSDELQNSDATTEIKTDTPIVADQETGSELATDTEGQQEQNSQAEIDATKKQDAINKAINEKHFKQMQAERERDEAVAKVAEFEKQQREAEAAKAGDIPPMPDELDDNFAEKLAAREEALVNNAKYQAGQDLYLQQQTALQQQQVAQQQANYQQARIAYNARATELGISPAELQAAETAVVNYGVNADTAARIMANKEDGPLIVKVLAENAADAVSLASMDPFAQGAFIAGLQSKVDALKPRQTNTPAPVETLTGTGAQTDLNKHPNSRGATFE